MQKASTLHRLQFLYDQAHQTAERIEHLPSALPLHIHPESLNWDQDLKQVEAEYNWLVGQAMANKTLTEADLAAAGLPARFPADWRTD